MITLKMKRKALLGKITKSNIILKINKKTKKFY